MGYAVKHSTSNVNKAFRKGNVVLGVSSDGYEDTDTSGLYNGVPPVAGKHNIVVTSATGDPDFYCVDESELPQLANNLGGSVDTTADALVFLAQQDNVAFTNQLPKDEVTDGLVLSLNASQLSSYPESGSTWYDLSGGGNNATLANSPTFNEKGYLDFDGVNDSCIVSCSIDLRNDFSLKVKFRYNEYESNALNGGPNVNRQQFLLTTKRYWVGNGTEANRNGIWIGWGGGNTDDETAVGMLVSLQANSTSSNHVYRGTTPLPYQWHEMVVTKNDNAFTTYIDGNRHIYTNSLPFTINTDSYLAGQLAIGGLSAPIYNYASASISEVQAYTKELTAEEVLQNYYGGPIVTDGLVFAIDPGNLVSYESGSTIANSMEGNYSGSLINGVSFNSGSGGYLNFDGTNDYIQVDGWNKSSTTNTYTVEMWARWRSGTGDMFMGFSSYDIWTQGGALGFNTGNGDVYGISSTQVNNLNLRGIDQSNWHHYIFEFTNQVQNNKIYIDGVEQELSQQYSTTNLTAIRNFPNSFRIGTWNNSTGYLFTGDVSTFRIYNRALTPSEVLQNYNAQKSRFI